MHRVIIEKHNKRAMKWWRFILFLATYIINRWFGQKKQKGKLKHNSNCNPIVFILAVFYTILAKNEMKKHHTGVIYGNDKILACQNLEFSTIWNFCGIIYLPSNICNPRLSLVLFNWYFPLRWNFNKLWRRSKLQMNSPWAMTNQLFGLCTF